MSWESVKEQIKTLACSEIIRLYLPLDRRGKGYLALCPFHNDSKPSLTVNDDKGLFRCFACDTGGDAISFVQKFRNLDFLAALEEIATKLSIPLPEKKDGPQQKKYTLAYELLKKASAFYQQSGAQEPLFAKFCKERGLSEKSVEDFELGYAPLDNKLLQGLLKLPSNKRESALKLALEIGLLFQYKNRYLETFRGRIIFPIHNALGKVIALSGRATLENQRGKYINSKESFLFNKRNILYGLHLAKKETCEQDALFICEGYMDTIKMHQHHFKNSVAVMGVALNSFHVQQIKRLSSNIYLAFDSDDAGFRATKKSQEVFLQKQIIPYVLNFSPAKDPDEYLQHYGPEKFQQNIKEAKTLLDQEITTLVKQGVGRSLHEKTNLLKSLYTLLAPLGESLEAQVRLGQFAKNLALEIDGKNLFEHFKNYLKNTKKTPRPPALEKKTTPPHPVQKPAKLSKTLLQCIKTLLTHPVLLEDPQCSQLLKLLPEENFQLFYRILESIHFEVARTSLLKTLVQSLSTHEKIAPSFKEKICALSAHITPQPLTPETASHIVTDLLALATKEEKRNEKKRLLEKLHLLEIDQNKGEEYFQIMQKISHLDKEILQIKKGQK